MAVAAAFLILALAAAACAILPAGQRWGPALLTVAAALAAPAALIIAALHSLVGMHLETDFGEMVSGVHLIVRVTPEAFALTVAIAGALLISALEFETPSRVRATHLAGAAGAMAAATAGNLILLGFGVCLVVSAVFANRIVATGRVPRGAIVGFGVGLGAALMLILAAAQLQSAQGTSDFSALPAGALAADAAMPWVVAACICLALPAFMGMASPGRDTLTMAAAATVPAGLAILVHLQEAADDIAGSGPAVLLGVLGCALGVGAVLAALRAAAPPRSALRWLTVAAAAPVLALAGLTGAAARLGFGAEALALVLIVNAAPLWRAGDTAPVRWAAAAVLLVANIFLPINAGVLGVGGVLATDGAGTRPLAVVLVGIAALGAAAAMRSIRHVFASRAAQARHRAAAVIAVGATVGFAGFLPGLAATALDQALELPRVAVDALTVSTSHASWPGGYVLIALLLVALAAWSFATLLGLHVALPAPGDGAVSRPGRRILLPRARRGRGIARGVRRRVLALDGWLAGQPQFGIAVLVVAAALIVIR